MNSNKDYLNLLIAFIMLLLLVIFLGYQYFMIYEFSDILLLIYF